MEENNNEIKVENLESDAVERKRVSVPLIPFIIVVVVGIVVFASFLKLFVFNEKNDLKEVKTEQNITADIIVEKNVLQY